MFEQNEEISYNPFEQEEQYDNSNEQQVENDHSEEFNNQKTNEELINSFYKQEMDEDDFYEMTISNSIAFNLYQSLYKLKKGTDQKLFKHPCQIKVYPKIKIMMIYLIVSHNFLRIKTELLYLKENPKYKKPDESELKKKINSKSIKDSQGSQSINDDQNDKGKEIIFTLELVDLFTMLDLLLVDNKDNAIIIAIDINLSKMKGRAACPETFNQNINEFVYEYNLIKNEVFKYEINPPEEPKYSEEKEGISKSLFNENDNEKDPDSSNININNLQSKSVSQISEENSDYLEKKFKTDEKCAKYLIEGNDLLELYQLMKGMEYIYQSFSTSSIGISMINDKALFFSLSYENIQDTKSITHLSKNIKHITELTVKCVKNHYLTPFKYGFNSFYRSSLLSKFITSFFNKEDKRLLVKVSPSGKMILSFAFSDYKNEREEIPNQRENNKDISMEINENLEQNNNGSENNRNNMRRIRRDGLLDDENGGNIVEMIFYPDVFDLCKE